MAAGTRPSYHMDGLERFARDHGECGSRSVPPSFQQASHLRTAFYGRALGRQLPRLIVVSWDIPGTCDIVAMTTAINMHVRRHDTYHSSFGFENGNIFRRTIADPEQIEFVPFSFGEMSAEDIREHAMTSTPETLDWDCFTFGIIQKPDHFTFYASVDHLHIDGMSQGIIFLDIHLAYQDLIAGRPVTQPDGQRVPQLHRSAERAGRRHGPVVPARSGTGSPSPRRPTATGRASRWSLATPGRATKVTSSPSSCSTARRPRPSTQLAATSARGSPAASWRARRWPSTNSPATTTYHGFTPSDTRTPGAETLSVGWFASLFPVTVPIGDGCFGDAARAAQKSFDSNRQPGKCALWNGCWRWRRWTSWGSNCRASRR